MLTFVYSSEEYHEAEINYTGRCTTCGATVSNVEIDAQTYRCEECGNHTVFGIGYLLLAGNVQIKDD